LPNKEPNNLLSSCFNNTAAAYKFYWFLSLIEEVEKGNHFLKKLDLFAGMIANSWYTVNYFNISLGKQDQLQRAIKQIITIESLSIDEKKSVIIDALKRSLSPEIKKILNHFDAEVPHRFLSPWFPNFKGNRKEIYHLSQDFQNNCLYAVNEQDVKINPEWIPYLIQNSGVLKAFCYWHLSLYLQKHNPNVPDIPNKLIKPPRRNSLIKHRKEFWDIVIKHTGPIQCIYTGKTLTDDYAVEHFIPYAFVSHDLIWNLIPADKSFNSSKCDKLPPMDKYFDAYFEIQERGLKTILENRHDSKFLEHYLTFIPDLGSLHNMSRESLKERFKDNIQPLVTIASNNGFEFM
ncbi:hypothetical protein DBR11_04415, partial [Pedobacter sp. HMWF019]|uniref:HNH endonuclease domain-containing protein n=1 Tax=Pedobacter sp. HMWF019 TaxID=2056856 RepID=UPI000D35BE92